MCSTGVPPKAEHSGVISIVLCCISMVDSTSYLYLATTNVVSLVAVLPSLLAVTTIRQLPAVVLLPTVQVQETLPLSSAVFGPRPRARLGPDL